MIKIKFTLFIFTAFSFILIYLFLSYEVLRRRRRKRRKKRRTKIQQSRRRFLNALQNKLLQENLRWRRSKSNLNKMLQREGGS
jgi:flagellar biosynthesis/type III secretory pathway M-ring protein FliF/YscJ